MNATYSTVRPWANQWKTVATMRTDKGVIITGRIVKVRLSSPVNNVYEITLATGDRWYGYGDKHIHIVYFGKYNR